MNANAPMLNENVRIPLHELQADVDYLLGRVVADGSCVPMIAKSIKDKLAQIEAGILDRPSPDSKLEAYRKALESIEKWFGEFPDTESKWPDGSPMSYGALFGTNGERDFMREVARKALAVGG